MLLFARAGQRAGFALNALRFCGEARKGQQVLGRRKKSSIIFLLSISNKKNPFTLREKPDVEAQGSPSPPGIIPGPPLPAPGQKPPRIPNVAGKSKLELQLFMSVM